MAESNFEFLKHHEPIFLQLATTAEKAFVSDPNTTLLKLRQLGEAFAKDIASRLGVPFDDRTTQLDLLKRIRFEVDMQTEIVDTFHAIRKIGNDAVHGFTSNHREAIQVLKLSWRLSLWYHRTFGKPVQGWKPGSFQTPKDPSAGIRALEEKILHLEKAQLASQRELDTAQQLAEAEKQKVSELEKYTALVEKDNEVWQSLAQEQEEALLAAQSKFNHELAEIKQQTAELTPEIKAQQEKVRETISKSVWDETEAETRLRIDQQLRDSGWEADTENLRYSEGSRPQHGRNMAIAEWPTASGPADYILFIGLRAFAVVEAKKTSNNVASVIDQAERYSQSIELSPEFKFVNGEWPASEIDSSKLPYKIPFAFSTNGRSYLAQHKEQSGIWFRDLRRPQNNRRANDGWYSPEGLEKLLQQDIAKADEKLREQDFKFDIQLRHYQVKAIRAAEEAIAKGQQDILLAMATGTGKTITCIAMIYRMLQAQRFRRILFLVDRSALGKQAIDSFKNIKMINQQAFDQIFNIKKLADISADSDTQVHIATVQGMVKRVLYSDDKPTVDQYDCIIVDECHRGYLLDRELNDSEIQFRSELDYISKYRRVVDYFDAVKIGLTATPALHTSEIFGHPVYTYSYREAVIDGYLIDHDPPIKIKTKHNVEGLKYQVGEKIGVYDVSKGNVEYAKIADELDFDITQINKKIIDKSFNKTVCNALASQIDFFGEEKTLIFCVTDRHADEVVELMKEAIIETYGENQFEDGLVRKITGKSDKPLTQILHYKNERLPKIAVTVDLLTTGIDVPPICNLVFLRSVKSRILYEQMKGRATRLCNDIGKEVFRIYDAVNLYDNLEPVTNMKPVVVNPNITFKQLEIELTSPNNKNESHQQDLKEQFIAKLHRKKNKLSEQALENFEKKAGQSPDEFIQTIQSLPIKSVIDWFINNPGLGEILDEKLKSKPPIMFITDKEDELLEVKDNYGKGVSPEDYLEEFSRFIKDNENTHVALKTIIHQPGKITRQQLKDLMLFLENEQFTEKNLRKAWALKTKKDIAARIVGYIRKASLGDALVPWEQRVDNAINVILHKNDWKPAQKTILQQIGTLLKTRLALDEHSINESALKTKYGPYQNINRLFDNNLPNILEAINDALWDESAVN